MKRSLIKHYSPGSALRRFGFRQTIKGALILGAIVGLMMGAQGAAYAKAFPSVASREKLVGSLSAVSGVNFLSGEIANAARPDSYAIYKSIALLTIVTGVWGMMVSTRLLRGFEEDGRLEILEAGALTKRQTNAKLLIGYTTSFMLSMAFAFLLIAWLGRDAKVALSFSGAAYTTVAVYLPGLFFAALGILTSQLARTRSRAIQYALVPLVIFYVIRGAANSDTSINWLKKITPFGWSDLLNPVLGVRPLWLIPTGGFMILFTILGMYWVGKRDVNEAILRQSDVARSHFYLLKTPFQLAVRQQMWTAMLWGLGTVAYAAFFAALANVSTKLASDSPAFKKALGATSNSELKLLFIGVGTMLVATILLVMATVYMSAIRRDEARSYLDNLLVQPVKRWRWLLGRVMLIASLFISIAVISAIVSWVIARSIHVDLRLSAALSTNLSLVGVLALVLGIGAFFYGVRPRLAVAAMTVAIGWAFVVDILKAFFHLSSIVTKTSIFTYISLNPSKEPDWVPICWLVVIGIGLTIIGTIRFGYRDITAE